MVSGSSQINITGTTEYSTFSSSISTSIDSLSSSVASTTNTLSSSVSSSIGSLSSSVATTTVGTKNRVDSIEAKTGSYATTGSNTFIGTENITGNLTVTGSVIISSGSAVYNSSLNLTDTSSLTLNSGSNLYVYDSGIISGTFKGSVTGSLGINGNVSITGSIVASGTSLVSGSSQIDITSTTNYTTFSSSVSSSIGNLSSSVATTTLNLSSSVSSSIGSLSSSVATTTSDLSSSIGSLSSSVATNTSGLAGRITTIEGNYATTGSNIFVGNQVITGSICSAGNIVTTGQIVAQTINVQQVTSSIVYSCGSNIFGTDINNTQQFTGSILGSGSLCINGPGSFSNTLTLNGSNNVIRSGNELRFNRADNAIYTRLYDAGPLASNGFILDNINGEGFHFQNNGVTILRIDSSNNLGVGTMCPLTKVDIVGNNNSLGSTNTLRFTDTDTATELNQQIGKIEFFSCDISTPGAGVKAYIGAFAQDSTPDAYLSFATQDGSGTPNPIERLRITSEGTACFAGQVCVGNASVATRSLVVQAGSTNQAIMFKNCWGGDGTLYACGNATAFHYGFNTYSCGDVLFIANGGNVGFSCNNPGYTIDVNGTGHFSSAGGTMLIESTQPTNASTLKIIQCSTGGNGNTDQGFVVQTNAGDGTSNIANFYDYNSGSPISRVRFLRSGITCFQNTICVAGQVSSEDVRIYRSAGTTTGYINFGSTGTNYLGFDGTRFSINGSINAGGATFSDVGDTCLVLRTTNSGNPRFKFCGAAGVFNRSAAADIMYFGESSDTGLYLFRGGTLMSDKGSCTSTYGFTHCGAGRYGRFGMPNSSFMYLETNADSGFYLDGQTRVGGYFCASGNVQGNNLLMYQSICGSGVRLGGSTYNTGYTTDGILGGTATPNYIVGTGYNSGFYLGYLDNGQGLYGAAYLFSVKCSHGGAAPQTAEYDAIRMRNAESGVIPFRVTNWGNLYATSKNFRINHPLPSMSNTHHLVHTAIEGPQADLIYRGKVELVNGRAEVNIDESSRMTEGTFELLCQNVQSYTTNESGWVLIKSYVVGNILHIEAQDDTTTDTISWLVIGERKDDGMKNGPITDDNGHLLVETLIPELES